MLFYADDSQPRSIKFSGTVCIGQENTIFLNNDDLAGYHSRQKSRFFFFNSSDISCGFLLQNNFILSDSKVFDPHLLR